MDITYTVLVTVGDTSTPLVIDTGSSDLWVISDACKTCRQTVPFYPQSTFRSSGHSALLYYGDSFTGSHAFGLVGRDTVTLAGLKLQNQFFAAINDTNTNVTETGAAGIFGLGFPVNSVIWRELFSTSSKRAELHSEQVISRESNSGTASDIARYDFPSLSDLYPGVDAPPSSGTNNSNNIRLHAQVASPSLPSPSFTNYLFSSFAKHGPLLGRLVVSSSLSAPYFSITLQRNTIDIGGNAGLLSIGALPSGVNASEITWSMVRPYSMDQGGLPPPANSPNERYPITWDVFIEDVYLDGMKLPRSNLSSPSIALSALIDTGNSIIRGPADVIRLIQEIISSGYRNPTSTPGPFPSVSLSPPASSTLPPHFPCSQPHVLAFQIGGQLFPVDPRDFVRPEFEDDVQWCRANLEVTDPPTRYLYSWSLGDPFLKSVLATFYYGNMTYPSRDPAKVGFISTVPADAGEKLIVAVEKARSNHSGFPLASQLAPVEHSTPTGALDNHATAIPPLGNSAPSFKRQAIVVKGWHRWAVSATGCFAFLFL